MKIYQDAEGGWIAWDGTTKHRYATETEAIQHKGAQERMAQETQLIRELQAVASAMVEDAAVARKHMMEAQLLYTDPATGVVTFSAEALAETGLTQEEATAALGAMSTLLSLTIDEQRALLVFRRTATEVV